MAKRLVLIAALASAALVTDASAGTILQFLHETFGNASTAPASSSPASTGPGEQLYRESGNTIIIEHDGNYVEFEKGRQMQGDYRIFGININPNRASPIGFMDAFLPMISLDRDRQIFKESGPQQCELRAAQEKKVVTVIFANTAVRDKIVAWKDRPAQPGHFALHLNGMIMRRVHHTYKGESMDAMTASGEVSINSILLLTDASIVPW